jgi:hypothetical protein
VRRLQLRKPQRRGTGKIAEDCLLDMMHGLRVEHVETAYI